MHRTQFLRRSLGGLICIALLWGALPAVAQPNSFEPLSSNPNELTEMDGYVYFCADDGSVGRELWRVDLKGNAELVKDITDGATGSDISHFKVFNGILYFRYRPEGDVAELWRSDGTDGGTYRFFRFDENGEGLEFSEIVGVAVTRMFLTVGSENTSKTIWESDGTPAGTRKILHPGGQNATSGVDIQCNIIGDDLYFSSGPDSFGVFTVRRTNGPDVQVLTESSSETGGFFPMDSGAVLFSAATKETGSELWIYDAEDGAVHPVKDIYTGPESSDPEYFHYVRAEDESILIFTATDAASGRELWRTDGTPEGTVPLFDLIEGPGSSNPSHFCSNGIEVYFIAVGEGLGKEVWKMLYPDAPRPVSDINAGPPSSDPYNFRFSKDMGLYFSATDGAGDEELWHSERGVTEVARVADIYPGPKQSFPDYAVFVKSELVFAATSAVEGRELWVIRGDGSLELLADIHTDESVNPASNPRDLTPTDFGLFFVANDLRHGEELWVSDGTPTGTHMVKDIYPDRPSSNISDLTPSGKLLFFVADDGFASYQLWRSDGTTQGTGMCRSINPTGSARPSGLTAFNGGLIFSAYRPLEGEELWIVRPGKEPEILEDIQGGDGSSKPRDLVFWKGHVYFHADDGVNGDELWRTDGTGEGTVMVKDLVHEPVEGISLNSAAVGAERLYFAASVDGEGEELWSLSEDGMRLTIVRDIARESVYDIRGKRR